MGKNDLIKQLLKEQFGKKVAITNESIDILNKEVELYLEPILNKAVENMGQENRQRLLPGDVRKGINFASGKKISRLLIAHVTAGAGHKRAAEAIAKSYQERYPNVTVKLVDTLDYINQVYKTVYNNSYLAMVKYTPRLWGYFYDRYDKDTKMDAKDTKLDDKFRQTIEAMQGKDFRELIEDFCPDAVICTHFLPMELISRWKKKKKSSLPLYAVVTDFALHSFWIVEEVDAYFVGSDEVRRELLTRGAKVKDIYAPGIPVDPVFESLPLQNELREKLSIQKDIPTILIMGGGFGVGDMPSLLSSFQSATIDMQILVVAGKNENLRKQLLDVARTLHLPHKIYGFVNNIQELMGAADLVITKPGGLSSSETLAAERPMMIINPIPGQEQRNSDYLVENGAASILHHLSDGAYYIEKLLKNKERLSYMTQQARRISKSHAAADIATKVVELANLEV